ncbi:hypothetical protein F2P56_030591, partial [Juglans regia]
MLEDESFNDLHAKLNDVINSRFNLGEKVEDSRVVRKILRSLPERFRPKVIAIKESKDLDAIKVEELVGSLQTYESSLPQTRKCKSIAFKTMEEDCEDLSDKENLNDVDIALIARKFRKFMFNKRTNGSYGHIRLECPNFKRTKFDYENFSSSCEDETSFIALSTVVNEFFDVNLTKSKSYDDDSDSEVVLVVTDHELSLQEAYNELLDVVKLKKLNKKLYNKLTAMENEKNNMSETVKISEVEVSRLNTQREVLENELEKVQKYKEKTATQKLDQMLNFKKSNCDYAGSQDDEAPKKVVSKTHVPRASHDGSMTKKPKQ